MSYRTAALAVAFTVILTGCNTNDNRSADNGRVYAQSKAAHNDACPVCGMPVDSQYSVSQDGRTVNCCSQACVDKFNSSSGGDRQRMMNKIGSQSSRGTSTFGANDNAYAESSVRGDSMRAESSMRAENNLSPISGKRVDARYSFVDEDGRRIGFASQEEADLYMSYGPEHRAEIRSHMR